MTGTRALESIYEREAECKALRERMDVFAHQLDVQVRAFHDHGHLSIARSATTRRPEEGQNRLAHVLRRMFK